MAEPIRQEQEGIFSDIRFGIVRSGGIDDELAQRLRKRIEKHGGTAVIDEYPEKCLSIEKLTYVISTTSEFQDYHESLERLKTVIHPRWVDMCTASHKLVHTAGYTPDPHLFFKDVVLTCAELPNGDKEAVAGGAIIGGGNYTAKLTLQVTHVVALNTDNEKCRQIKEMGLDMKIVLPHWFDNCIRLGRKIDEKPYLFPRPMVGLPLEEAPQGPSRQAHLHDATWATPWHPLTNTARDIAVLKERRFYLEPDLQLSSELRRVIGEIIAKSGGEIVDDVTHAQVLVCKYRHGSNYVYAEQAELVVGSLSWLYWLTHHEAWAAPREKLLHYPIPKSPLAGFAGKKIALSNYCGDARIYVENLILALGAEFSKHMSEECDYLVTGHMKSHKVDAAREWNIEIINHLWLEDSFVQWKKLPITLQKYTCFPEVTNLGEVAGLASINRQVVWNNFVHPFKHMATTVMGKNTGKKTYSPRDKSVAGPSATPVRVQRNITVTEEDTPEPQPGARSAKLKAVNHLHEMKDDIALYEKERKRVGGVTHGRERKGSPSHRVTSGKRSAEADDCPTPRKADTPAKRQRLDTDEAEPRHFCLLVTGHTPWSTNETLRKNDVAKLKKFGIEVTQDPVKANIVAAPRVVRTPKFLCALAYNVQFVTLEWFLDSMEQKTVVDPSAYTLIDPVAERDYEFSFKKSKKLAKTNQQQLLAGVDLCWMPETKENRPGLEDVAKANGAALTLFTAGPSGKGRLSGKSKEAGTEMILLTSNASDPKQHSLCKLFTAFAASRQRKARIIDPDWLTRTALCQKIEPWDNYESYKTD